MAVYYKHLLSLFSVSLNSADSIEGIVRISIAYCKCILILSLASSS